MFHRVTSKVSEFLVVRRRGALENLGAGASALIWPGTSHVTVSAAREEACFELTQETSDGIPLRMKGIVVYRVIDPVAAALRFDFSADRGHAQIQALLTHVCLGELRAVATSMSMQECIAQRKTTLTEAVAGAVRAATTANGVDWGLSIDVVQVAQVFIVDADLRQKLEAEVRSQLSAQSQLAELAMRDQVAAAELSSRRWREAEVEADRVRRSEEVRAELERAQALARARLTEEATTRGQELAEREALAASELEGARRELALRTTRLEVELIGERARQALRLEALPLEQVPFVAEALSRALQGASLSFYGADAAPLAGLTLLSELVRDHLVGLRRRPPGPEGG